MNFGTIVDSIMSECLLLISEGNKAESSDLAKQFVRHIELKDGLKRQFVVYQQLKTTTLASESDAKTFVTETLKYLDRYSFNDIKAINAIFETRFKAKKRKSSKLNSAIATLIRRQCSDTPITARDIESSSIIVQHILDENKSNIPDQLNEEEYHMDYSTLKYFKPKHILNTAVKTFNAQYNLSLNDNDRRVFEAIRSNNIGKMSTVHTEILTKIDRELERLGGSLNEELSTKVSKAKQAVTDFSLDNLYDAHDLLSELKNL